MGVKPETFYNLTNEQLLERSAGAQGGSEMARAVEAEYRRRALLAQVEAAEASKEAAQAAQTTARWTRLSAVALAVSVAVMAVGTWVSA